MRPCFRVIYSLILCLLPLSTYADAEMFRPFEGYIEAKFSDCQRPKEPTCRGLRCERYEIKREPRGEYWKKQRYYNRHCGSAYISCFYPDEDYPRYNGRPLDLRWYQRQPYYPPFR